VGPLYGGRNEKTAQGEPARHFCDNREPKGENIDAMLAQKAVALAAFSWILAAARRRLAQPIAKGHLTLPGGHEKMKPQIVVLACGALRRSSPKP
jgi:hypothetical protein